MDQMETSHFKDCLDILQRNQIDVIGKTSSNCSTIVRCNLFIQDFLYDTV